jgi:Tol biopolymer transport system component
MGRRWRLLAFTAALAIPGAEAANPPQVAFNRIDEPPGIWLLDQTGEGARELTRGKPGPVSLGTFAWSPDGSRVVYASGERFSGDLFALGVDDGRVEKLTSQRRNEHPAWSPDGRRIAYVHGETSGTVVEQDIWLVDAAGGGVRRLTSDRGLKSNLRWSPDGSRLLYSQSGSASGLTVIDAESGRRLVRTTDYQGVWSPDGSRVAADGGGRIDVFAADGTGRRTVARDGAEEPQWSPDGSRIAFWRRYCFAYFKGICSGYVKSVYAVGADGSGEIRLTGPIAGGPHSQFGGRPADSSEEPAWWPNGSRLLFRQDDYAHVMNADGTCEQPFGPRSMQLGQPAWRPGATPSLPPVRCIDLRVRAGALRPLYGRRDDPRLRIVVENDGNQTATAAQLTIRVARGRGRVRAPARSCRGATVVRCELPPLAAGASTQLLVTVAGTRPRGFRLSASAAAHESDSDPGQNAWSEDILVLDCDVAGTEGPDRLVGTPRRDSICALPGADRISAGAGADTIDAGAGPDTIRPGPGRDLVLGAEGRDRIYARDGQRDRIDCGAFLDAVYADHFDRLLDCERVSRR